MAHKHTNALIEETSPYLLQHAHNPVDWHAWHPEVLAKAQKENKPLLISIGYAACHWCHVMEEECFEDEAVAQMMNENFINVKIDREERPDVDHIYMDALHMMTGSGGWPLNVVALPDGRPFWGATYLPKDTWLKSLEKLTELHKTDPQSIEDYASKLKQGIHSINLIEQKEGKTEFGLAELEQAVAKWATYFDTYLGGYKRAPKFMMPNNLDFLLHYATSQKDEAVLDYVNTTLTRMAYGGIFDQVGGGFSRYSVDTKWHVPHFEKMLYDNGQLISLYAKAYAVTKNPLYREVVAKTIAFVMEELHHEAGGFFASLDADSTNEMGTLEEGAFYVWKEAELQQLLGADYEIFKAYFNINSYGLWENENYVLIRDKTDAEIATTYKIQEDELTKRITSALQVLKQERNKRAKPRLDDKILTSWNALMLNGLVDAYRYLGDETYLKTALTNAAFIKNKMLRNDGGLFRNHKNGKSSINGFLDDYAITIEAFIGLYQVTFDEQWMNLAKGLTDYAVTHFRDDKNGMFYYTSDEDETLIRRTVEANDDVISASNSIMAKNLLKLHKLYPKMGYGDFAEQMIANVQDNFMESGQGYANWMHLVLYENLNFYEIAVVGDDFHTLGAEIHASYLPNSILVGTRDEGTISLLKNRHSEGQTLVYVCIEGACKLPVTSAQAALEQL